MKLRVQHEDGRVETITLRGAWTIKEGPHLNRITDQSGFEHFFTHEGHYDGWGGAAQQAPDTARELIEAMEQKREFSDR